MRKVKYVRVDVFTRKPFGGNPLAVFPDARSITPREMQLLAREMNLSETTFVLPPSRRSGADFRVRIFTPDSELPYAGHPTLGTFFVLGEEGRIRLKEPVTEVKMEVGAGVLPVEIRSRRRRVTNVVTVQGRPEFGPVIRDVRTVAEALSLDVSDIDTKRAPVQLVSTGLPWVMVPVTDRGAVERAAGNASVFARALMQFPRGVVDMYVTCTDPVERSSTAHSRAFSLVARNISEDPATGSASGCLGAYLVKHGLVPRKDTVRIVNEQGYEIGRPSKIAIEVRAEGRAGIGPVRVGGPVVKVMEGHALLS
jgi:trans-2,3-dihydro-3-hydroxyanthranilate isomerase